MQVLDVLRGKFSRLRLIWADQAYAGDLLVWVWALCPWRKVRLDIVKRPPRVKGFLRLPKRWIVEMCQPQCCCTSFSADGLAPSYVSSLEMLLFHSCVRRRCSGVSRGGVQPQSAAVIARRQGTPLFEAPQFGCIGPHDPALRRGVPAAWSQPRLRQVCNVVFGMPTVRAKSDTHHGGSGMRDRKSVV